MQTFKSIIGGVDNTPEEVFAKFPWLAKASFEDAEVDISKDRLIWLDGIWRGGTWYGGTWHDGRWIDGTWVGGTWQDGTWHAGQMWSSIDQNFIDIESWDSENKKFIIKK